MLFHFRYLLLLAYASSLQITPTLAWQKYANSVLSGVMYIDMTSTVSFGYYAQVADKSLLPLLNKIKGVPTTILMPTNDAFTEFVTSNQGNESDPRTLITPVWKTRWNDKFEYFFAEGSFNSTGIEEGTTVYLDTHKVSPDGDWPLSIAYRKNVGVAERYLAEVSSTYNGTFYSAPYSAGNITIPEAAVETTGVTALSIDFWPEQPLNLSSTISAYNMSSQWTSLLDRLPDLASLNTQRNFTLFLPPLDTILLNSTMTSEELKTFMNAHIVNNTRVALSSSLQSFTNINSDIIQATGTWVVGPTGINASVIIRDQVTTGGILQLLDRALV